MNVVTNLVLILAFVCFVVAAVKPEALPRLNLIAIGLALWVLNALVALVPR